MLRQPALPRTAPRQGGKCFRGLFTTPLSTPDGSLPLFALRHPPSANGTLGFPLRHGREAAFSHLSLPVTPLQGGKQTDMTEASENAQAVAMRERRCFSRKEKPAGAQPAATRVVSASRPRPCSGPPGIRCRGRDRRGAFHHFRHVPFLAEPVDADNTPRPLTWLTTPHVPSPGGQLPSAQRLGVSGSKVSTAWGWNGRDQE